MRNQITKIAADSFLSLLIRRVGQLGTAYYKYEYAPLSPIQLTYPLEPPRRGGIGTHPRLVHAALTQRQTVAVAVARPVLTEPLSRARMRARHLAARRSASTRGDPCPKPSQRRILSFLLQPS